MADYEREQQNNELLNSLSSKVSALKNVTIDIYDNARDQESLDHSVCLLHLPTEFPMSVPSDGSQVFSSLSTNLKGSANRLTRMARQGDTVAVLKVAGIVIGAGVLLWLILGWIF
ncbi:hypothetical protein BJX63DRAFT_427851 [Aspergillus granulosus]|uniref:Uncharacterized protein n=1 Tax=Aspergillus granulosus TaxID=176169 RepID=A0ABR4I0B1_9EURO